jgi:hypothetical protein
MKIATVLVCSLLGLPLAAAQAAQAAEPPGQALQLPAFDAIEFHGAGQLEVAVGAPQSVVAVAASATLAKRTLKVVGNTLLIEQPGYRWRAGDPDLKVAVSLPVLAALTARGKSQTQVTGLADGSTRILLAQDARLAASGRLQQLTVRVDEASVADFARLEIPAAQVSVPDWGRARFNANTALYSPSVGVGSLSTLGQPMPIRSAAEGLARHLR